MTHLAKTHTQSWATYLVKTWEALTVMTLRPSGVGYFHDVSKQVYSMSSIQAHNNAMLLMPMFTAHGPCDYMSVIGGGI